MTTDSDSECSYVANLADFNVIRVVILILIVISVVIVIIIVLIVYDSNKSDKIVIIV